MALSDVQIAQGQKYLKAWQKCTSRPMAAHHLSFAQAIEAEVRKADEELIRQLVEALEHIHRCIPIGGFAQIHWGSSTFEQIVQAAEAGRARLEQPC